MSAPSARGRDAISDEEDAVDTLRASDLTAADLAALASLAKKKSASQHVDNAAPSRGQETSFKSQGVRSCHISPSGQICQMQHLVPMPMSSFEEDEDDFSWADDFDFQDSMIGLKSRTRLFSGTSHCDGGSEVPSLESTSDINTEVSDGRGIDQKSDGTKSRPMSGALSVSGSSPNLQSAAASTSSKASGKPLIVGDMIFDAKKLCWVRRDGQDEEDPFELDDCELWSEHSERGDVHSSGAVAASREPALRRVQSDSPLIGGLEDGAPSGIGQAGTDTPLDALRDDGEQCKGPIKGPMHGMMKRSSSTYRAEEIGDSFFDFSELLRIIDEGRARDSDSVPAELQESIPLSLWTQSFRASERHVQEVSGFVPRFLRSPLDGAEHSLPVEVNPRTSSLSRASLNPKQRHGSTLSPTAEPSTLSANERTSWSFLLRNMARKGKNKASTLQD